MLFDTSGLHKCNPSFLVTGIPLTGLKILRDDHLSVYLRFFSPPLGRQPINRSRTTILNRVFAHTCSQGHGGAVVTHSAPTSEVCGSNPRPYVGKLVVAY